MNPKVTLDQWRAFIAVVEQGGYAQAADSLHLSQSTVSYAVARLQELLGTRLLAVTGRKAQLTPAGKALLPRARQLVMDAYHLEAAAEALHQGWETEIVLVTDVLCPSVLLLDALADFQPHSRGTDILIREEVLSGTEEVILNGQAHLGLHPHIPAGCHGEWLLNMDFIPVSHPEHELQRLNRPLEQRDLGRSLQIFIRDTGSKKGQEGLVCSPRRWTVSSRDTALEMLRHGFGFCWVPSFWVAEDLSRGHLRALPLEPPDARKIAFYLIYPPTTHLGPATKRLAQCLREAAKKISQHT